MVEGTHTISDGAGAFTPVCFAHDTLHFFQLPTGELVGEVESIKDDIVCGLFTFPGNIFFLCCVGGVLINVENVQVSVHECLECFCAHVLCEHSVRYCVLVKIQCFPFYRLVVDTIVFFS